MSAAEANKPKTFFGRVGTTLAIVLTGIGTGLAGLSTGQMEFAMYWRSLAAQDQARATSQWALAGFKKTRSVSVGSSSRTLRAVGGRVSITSPEKFRKAVEPVLAGLPAPITAKFRAELDALLASPDVQRLFQWMSGDIPPAKMPEVTDEPLRALLDASRARKTTSDIRQIALPVERTTADDAIRQAELFADKYDADQKPIVDAEIRLDKFVTELDAAAADTITDPGVVPPHVRAATALLASTQSSIDALDERLYEQETRISQRIGDLYEARVIVTDVKADRYRLKSLYIFYALIAVQVAAGLAAFGSDRNALIVLLALLVGLAGIAFGAYSYLSSNPTVPGLG